MTNEQLRTLLFDCKASVIFEMEQAQYMGETVKTEELSQLVDEIDMALGKADANLIDLASPKQEAVDFDEQEYLYSKLKM